MHVPVLVVTEEKPAEADLEAILTPWLHATAEDETSSHLVKPPGPRFDYFEATGRFGHVLSVDPGPPPDSWTVFDDRGSMRKRDIAIDALRARAGGEAAAAYDRRRAIIGNRSVPDATHLRAASGTRDGHAAFWNDPAIVALRQAGEGIHDASEIVALAGTRESAVEAASRMAALCAAIVIDGAWYEPDDRNAFFAEDPEALGAWSHTYWTLLDRLAPEAWFTVVDCHA